MLTFVPREKSHVMEETKTSLTGYKIAFGFFGIIS